MRPVAVVMVLAVSLIVSGHPTTAGPRDITVDTVLAVQAWVRFVERHTPGRRDAPVEAVAAWSFDARRTLNDGIGLFLSALLRQRVVTGSDPETRIVAIARIAEQTQGADVFLKRAAVLHSDAAIFGDPPPAVPVGTSDVPPRGAPVPPLLSKHTLFLDKDGEILGEAPANWNWPFARSLLDLVRPEPARDPFVGAWYHAAAAYMLARGLYGEATPHLARAADVLPDDARLLFDRGSYAEFLGLPMSQVLLSDADILTLRAQHMGQRASKLTVSSATKLGIPPADIANADAERLFRHALRVDPWLVEARVRLARLLDLRKRHEEAAAELDKALKGGATGGPVAFYAHLFAGRAAQALGRMDAAARHFQQASALFPGAQSALLARSQLALLRSDVSAAIEPVERLDKSSSASDPWWKYQLAAGRDADALLAEMWRQVSQF